MKKVVSADVMIHYVENKLRLYLEIRKAGCDTSGAIEELLACKYMTEALLGVTIHLKDDGTLIVA